jgi:orotate phosphoribosyltransferase
VGCGVGYDPDVPSTSPLAQRIFHRAHLTGEFRLRSGAVSGEYFDKYLFESDPALLLEIARQMIPLLPPELDAVAGLELGGIPLVTMLSQLTGTPALFVRKQAKEYGTCRLAEGGEVEGRRIAVIEDVVTSGGQLIAYWLLQPPANARYWSVNIRPDH